MIKEKVSNRWKNSVTMCWKYRQIGGIIVTVPGNKGNQSGCLVGEIESNSDL